MKLLAPVALFFALLAATYGVTEVYPVATQKDAVRQIKQEVARLKQQRI